ncbi:MAG: hypothetical protein PHP23_14205 [Desulfobacterales bacterium]|nr:hypothetical protein [Desulfobacterales bacterium]MDD4073448.1 hypothetical protein [Desulfobacterales bacterium]MDD4414669.1 hypothetical protein [Oscillospiraceae bacterium]
MAIHTINIRKSDIDSDKTYNSLFITIPESKATAEKSTKFLPKKPLDKSRAELIWYKNHFWPF